MVVVVPGREWTVESTGRKRYEQILADLKFELAKLECWVRTTGQRVVARFAGRDAAGKDETINVLQTGMNPRTVKTVAPGPS